MLPGRLNPFQGSPSLYQQDKTKQHSTPTKSRVNRESVPNWPAFSPDFSDINNIITIMKLWHIRSGKKISFHVLIKVRNVDAFLCCWRLFWCQTLDRYVISPL